MQFTAPQNFDSLTEALRFYGDADEIVFKNFCSLDEQEIAELCREARKLAEHLRLHQGRCAAAEIASRYGVEVIEDRWEVAGGKVLYLAECSLRPPRIRLNREAIEALAALMSQWATEEEQGWFTEEKLTEVTLAHELYHLLAQRPPSSAVELAAHAFARAFTGLPFSPRLYQALLARLSKREGGSAA